MSIVNLGETAQACNFYGVYVSFSLTCALYPVYTYMLYL